MVQHLHIFEMGVLHINLANMHGITLIPAYIAAHLNVEADFLSWGRLVP